MPQPVFRPYPMNISLLFSWKIVAIQEAQINSQMKAGCGKYGKTEEFCSRSAHGG